MIQFSVAILSGCIALFINLGLIPLIIKFAHHFKLYDLPDKRKIHTGLIPRLGGSGIFLSFIITIILTYLILYIFNSTDLLLQSKPRFYALFSGIFLIHIFGLYDDLRNVKAPLKLFFQTLAAAIVAGGGYLIHSLTIPYLGTINLGLFAYPVTIIWIVGISNAINLIDGMDGLAGGICAFAALSMGIIALIQGQILIVVLCFALFGSITGFLFYNYPPAKIFMGDSGSLFLGFSLSVFPLMGISKASAFGTLIVPITLLLIPIMDTAGAILRRIRQKRPIHSPDKEHIHHKLLDMGLSERQILSVIYGISFYLGVVSITSVVLPKEINVYLIMVVWIGSMLGYWFLSYINAKRHLSRAEEEAGAEEKSS